MSSTAADRIRTMREKGTITQEQAEELLSALSESHAQDKGATAAEPGPGQRAPGPQADPEGSPDGSRARGRRRSRGFLDMDWVGDMVDGITSGLDAGLGRAHPGSDRPGDNYRYEWDPRWGRRKGGNAENSSRVEQPEGEAFEFQENRVVFSKLSGLRLVRAKVRDNSFSASTLRGAALTDSAIIDSSLAGASVHDLLMDRSELKDVVIAGSKINRLEMRSGSAMKNVKISGSPVSGLTLEQESRIEDTRLAGVVITGCTLSGKTRIKDTRFNGTALNHLTLEEVTLTDTRFDGCTLGNSSLVGTEVTGCVLRGVSLQDSKLTDSRIKDSRLEAVGFGALKIERSELRNLVIRDAFDGRFPRKAESLSLVDVKLDNVQFIGCIFRDTTFKGISADGLKIRGRDLSGRTFESADELRTLSER
jgi:uncharacterized protein YjbI with pentapeptide repeats